MNFEMIKELYNTDDIAEEFFDLMSTRQRSQSETKVSRVLKLFKKEGTDISKGKIIELFRKLNDAGSGQFITGRRGWPSRFVWDVNLLDLAKKLTGDVMEEDEDDDEEDIDEYIYIEDAEIDEDDFITHSFNLRPDIKLKFKLPIDLSEKEAERLSSFIYSLPMEE